jgi:hypothetical protein
MTREELALLTTEVEKVEGPVKVYRPAFSRNSADRTLLYGYDCDRNTFHVYLKDDLVHLVVYKGSDMLRMDHRPKLVARTEFKDLSELAPNKRVYAEASDYEFCRFLKEEGVWISFASYGNERTPAKFYGRVAD